MIASARGEYGRATGHAREAERIARAVGDASGESRALNAAAIAQVYRGELRDGLATLERALALSRAARDREAEIDELNNTGTACFLQARYLDALRAYRAAETVVDAAAGEPWQPRRRRLTTANVAALLQRLGAYERALDLYRAMQEAPAPLSASEQARVLTNMGALYRRLEDPLKALETYAAAQRLFARERHDDGEIGVLKNVGIVHALDLGDLGAALQAFSGALALAERRHDAHEATQARLYRGETLLRMGELPRAAADLEAALAAADARGATEERWMALDALGRVERARGRDDAAAARFRDAIAAIESVRTSLQLPALKTDFLADKRSVYDGLVELVAARGDVAGTFHLLERSRARTLQDRMAEAAPAGAAPGVTLSAVQGRLEPGTLLLEYWITGTAAAVVWVTRDAAGIAALPLPPAAELAAFAREVTSGTGDGWRRGASALGARLLSGIPPLAGAGAGVKHVVVVPDGPLGAVPFEALAVPGAGGALAVERFAVSYLPSASILLRPPAAPRWSPPWRRHLLAFGDPLVAADPAGGGALVEPLAGDDVPERLPASAEEVRAVARLVGGHGELRLGPENRRSVLLQGGARDVALLHLSTHATADDVSPERSRIQFSPEDGERAGYLFLKEVFDLDLRGVELATLSACDTERGKVIRGEGLQAFSRALLSAGARATVTTLWRVADRPTTEFMKQLYFRLGRGEPKGEALRLAKLSFLGSGGPLAHPRFWAAFVLNGDALRAIPRGVSWGSVLGPLLAAVLAGAAVVVARRLGPPRARGARARRGESTARGV
ncbi:MAG TPA: CHAT domain-containing tetratricopeptide repeat protein [Anaeromyxobacter sp.]|nr:CHAT domain-containing tetratricopeptide repeat protein [Anaeromyxobacter sp.]